MNHHGIHLPNFKEEMTELYANRVIRYFGMSLVYVFIPVYLINIGFSFQQAILYIALKRAFLIASVPVALYLESKAGLKQTAMASTFLLSSFLIYLYTDFEISLLSLASLCLLEGAGMALYWVPMNIGFGLASKKGKQGEETAMIISLPKIAGIFTPVIGALVINMFGFGSLLMTSCLIIACSALPLFATGEKIVRSPSVLKVGSFKARSMAGLFALEGILSVSLIAWPLFVFLFAQNYEFIGITASAQVLSAVAATFAVGRLSDKTSRKKLFQAAGLLSAAVFVAAMAARTPEHAVIVSFLTGIAEALVAVPVFAYVVKMTEKKEMAEVMAYREIMLSFAMIVALSLFFVLEPLTAFYAVFLITTLACAWLASYNPKE
ncbi:MAG: MFS transporter [archaeon]